MAMGFDKQGDKKSSIFLGLGPAASRQPEPDGQRSGIDQERAAQLKASIEAIEKKVLPALQSRIASLEKDNAELRAVVLKLMPPPQASQAPQPQVPGALEEIKKAMVKQLDVKVSEFGQMTSSLVKYLRDSFSGFEIKFENRLKKIEAEILDLREEAKSGAETVHAVEATFKSMTTAIKSDAAEQASRVRSVKSLEERFSHFESSLGRYQMFENMPTKVSLLESRCDFLASAQEQMEGKLKNISATRGADVEKMAEISRDFWDLRGRFDHIAAIFNSFRNMLDGIIGRQREVEMKVERELGPGDPRIPVPAGNRELNQLIDSIEGRRTHEQ